MVVFDTSNLLQAQKSLNQAVEMANIANQLREEYPHKNLSDFLELEKKAIKSTLTIVEGWLSEFKEQL